MRPSVVIPVAERPGPDLLDRLRGGLAEAAARVHAGWEQGPDGLDAELGEGGICQDVASAMAGVLSEAGVEHALTVHASVGENHVFVVALLSDGVYEIDIPPSVYERGSGYRWAKRSDAVFDADSVTVLKIEGPLDPDTFMQRFGD